jgi:hypothetical protein
VATINGTNGNNNLIGTPANDVFKPFLGIDTVSALEAGTDRLNVNYASLGVVNASLYFDATGLYGNIYDTAGLNSVNYSGIEFVLG